MKIGRGFVLLLFEQRAEGGFLFGAALEDEQHAPHRKAQRGGAAVEFGASQGVRVALQPRHLRFVDGGGDARADVARLRRRQNGSCETERNNQGEDRK